jgi:hypothetical protein
VVNATSHHNHKGQTIGQEKIERILLSVHEENIHSEEIQDWNGMRKVEFDKRRNDITSQKWPTFKVRFYNLTNDDYTTYSNAMQHSQRSVEVATQKC